MPITEVEAPDGTVLEVTHPDGATERQILRAASKLWKPDPARQKLPEGVAPSTAGAGRGNVNPPVVQPRARGGLASEGPRPYVAAEPLAAAPAAASPASPADEPAIPPSSPEMSTTGGVDSAELSKPARPAGSSILDEPAPTPPAPPTAPVGPGKKLPIVQALEQAAKAAETQSTPIRPQSFAQPTPQTEIDKLADEAQKATGSPAIGSAVRSGGDKFIALMRAAPQTGSLLAGVVQLGPTDLGSVVKQWFDKRDQFAQGLQSNQEKERLATLQAMAQDPRVGTGELTNYLLDNPDFLTNQVLPSLGSLLIGTGGAKLGMAMAERAAVNAGLKGAALNAAIADGATKGATIANALMNAGETFDSTDGSGVQKYLAAMGAAATTIVTGRITGGGAEAGVASGVRRVSQNPVVDIAAKGATSAAREGLQEGGEQLGQDVSQTLAEGKPLDAQALTKSASAAAVQGAVMGGPAGVLSASTGVARDNIHGAIDDAAGRFGLSPKATQALREAMVGMETEQATRFVEAALGNYERRGVASRPGVATAFRDALGQRTAKSKAASEKTEAAEAAARSEPEAQRIALTEQRLQAGAALAASRGTGELSAADLGLSEDTAPAAPDGNVSTPSLETPQVSDGTSEPAAELDTKAHEAATSPKNDLPEPTPAQQDAGNYRKGHIRLQGLDISVENPVGSTRSGTDPDGKVWTNTMAAHRGYIKGTQASDGDQVDVFVGPNPAATTAFVIDQVDPRTGRFDEPKVVLGADNEAQARDLYQRSYSKDWKGLGAITALPMDQFKQWARDGVKDQPLGKIAETPKTVQLDGQTWTVAEDKSNTVKLVSAAGKPRVLQKSSATWARISDSLGSDAIVENRSARKLAPVEDKRLLDPSMRSSLQAAKADIGWSQVGGRMLRGDPDEIGTGGVGSVTGRTPWIGSELWSTRPNIGGRVTEAEANDAIDKVLSGRPMTAKQRRFIAHALDVERDRAAVRREILEQKRRAAMSPEARQEEDDERAAIMAESALSEDDMAAVASLDDSDIPWDTLPDASQQTFYRDAGASDEAIQEFLGSEEAESPVGDRKTAARAAAAADGIRGEAPGPEEGLTAPTAASLLESSRRIADLESEDRAEQRRLADKARADAELGEFALTGSDRAADVSAAGGQTPLFSRSDQSRQLVALRKRVSVLRSLAECLKG
jgi:Inorganic Pyrophosphatase